MIMPGSGRKAIQTMTARDLVANLYTGDMTQFLDILNGAVGRAPEAESKKRLIFRPETSFRLPRYWVDA